MVYPKNPSDPVYLPRYQCFCQGDYGCPPVSSIIKTRWLRFLGHMARSDSRQDHHRAVSALLWPPRDWRRPRGHLRTMRLRGIDADVQLANIGIHSLSLEEGQRPCSLVAYHRHGNTPLGARHWRIVELSISNGILHINRLFHMQKMKVVLNGLCIQEITVKYNYINTQNNYTVIVQFHNKPCWYTNSGCG